MPDDRTDSTDSTTQFANHSVISGADSDASVREIESNAPADSANTVRFANQSVISAANSDADIRENVSNVPAESADTAPFANHGVISGADSDASVRENGQRRAARDAAGDGMSSATSNAPTNSTCPTRFANESVNSRAVFDAGARENERHAPTTPATPQVIESASATTSPERNRGGKTPVVIAGVVLAVLVLVAALSTNLLASMVTSLTWLDGAASTQRDRDGLDSELDDLLDELGIGNDSGSRGYGNEHRDSLRGSNPDRTALTTDNALDYDLTFVQTSLADVIFASDYSGAQTTVSDFVRQAVRLDDEGINAVDQHLRAARTTDDDRARTNEITQAHDAATKAYEAALALAAPTDVTGTNAGDVSDDLMDAREDLMERWEDVAKAVSLISNPENHTIGDLRDVDEDAAEVDDLAQELFGALTLSAQSR